nr:ubiquitin-conjugating enzyme E2 J1 isoform X2 [Pelodiscus sinensis]|eukprot:XP_025045553.1 ubiquitin-conjugating enzyme E2 J1 isoform X2 [Pelodiscus sinensis]
MKEAAELKDPTDHYHAQPLEDNLFEWHFTVRGPPDSDFDGGVYHGRIVLPPEYPMKPPSIILLTANGRFEVGKKICLSISGHHPETWQPSWSIRTALLAIIGFMPTKGEGAIGSLDYTPEERRALAKKSQDFCCEAEINSSRKCITESPHSSELNHSATLPEPQQDGINRGFQNPTTSTMSEIQNSTTPSNQEHTQPISNNTSMSPRQRRAQQQSQRRTPSSTDFNQVQQPRVNTGRTGSTVLIVLLTLALAALIFRRIYLANDYMFEL